MKFFAFWYHNLSTLVGKVVQNKRTKELQTGGHEKSYIAFSGSEWCILSGPKRKKPHKKVRSNFFNYQEFDIPAHSMSGKKVLLQFQWL